MSRAEITAAWVDALGGRKFIMSIGCGAVTTLLCWFGKIDGATYSLVTLGTVGAYIAGNTVQKRVQQQTDSGR